MAKEKLGYQANGRLKKSEKVEKAHLTIKKFICPNCHNEIEGNKTEFGEGKLCPVCGSVMIHQY
jgi:NAD-dependent SIR2 family protein deacetylase